MHAILLTALLLTADAQVELRMLDGPSVSGTLADLSATEITLDTGSGRSTVTTDKLLGLAPAGSKPLGEKPAVWVELIDGSQILAKDYAVKERKATLTLLDATALEVDAAVVANVRLRPSTEVIDKEWQRILEGSHAADVMVVHKDDTIDYHKGVVHDVSDSTVAFELDGEKLPVKRSRVFGVIYYHAPRTLPGPVATVVGSDGSRWAARTLALGAEQKLSWTTSCGVSIERPLASVNVVDFSGGKIIYLSDLEPDSATFTPYFTTSEPLPALTEFYAPRKDSNLSAQPIQLSGEKYSKGIAVHSRTELVYRLPGRFNRFRAIAGIDDEVAPHGHVRLVIRGDERVLLETDIAGGEKPLTIDLDLSGVKRLAILVDFGEKLDVADHLDLALARISK